MKAHLSPYALGATLYMPATRSDLWAVVSGQKIAGLKSLVICLEDAVSEQDIGLGLQNLQHLVHQLSTEEREAQVPLVFVRPRHTRMAAQLSEWPLIHQIDGMVLPKFDMNSVHDWHKAVVSELLIMPTLETPQTFDPIAMRELRHILLDSQWPVLALRIGGNDLLACLGLRRPNQSTIYQTPLGALIGQLVSTFSSHGFALTAPVCEYFDNIGLLQTELRLDLSHGLVGKTVIHPRQVEIVHHALQVATSDYIAAQAILAPDAPAVFQYEGAMLEPTTHKAWAHSICERVKYYGLNNIGAAK